MNDLKCLTLEEFIFEKQQREGKKLNEQEKKEDSDFLSKKPDETIGDLAINKAKDLIGDLVQILNKVYKKDIVDGSKSDSDKSAITENNIMFKNGLELLFTVLGKTASELQKLISNLKMSEFLLQCPFTIKDSKGNMKVGFIGQLFAPEVVGSNGPNMEKIDSRDSIVAANHAKLGVANLKKIGGFDSLVS